jgi:hypothetical protein
MILLCFIFVLTTFLAFGVKSSNTPTIYSGKYSFTKKPHYEAVIVFFIFIMLASFSGFRSEYNDTAVYLYNFSNEIPQSFDRIVNIDWSLGQNPGFIIYQIFIKQFISTNQYIFILFTSTIVTCLFVESFYRYSRVFYFTIFLFIASGLFIFTMAAMKQVLAMSIGFWSIRIFLKEKYLKSIFIITLASTLHPYILLYLLAFFFRNEVWSKKIIVLLIATIFVGVLFNQFLSIAVNLNSELGNVYDIEYFENKAGMNKLRVTVFSVVPILSFIYRKKINKFNNQLLNLSINFSVVSFLFMIIASFGAANMFGRVGVYFEPFIYISLPWIIHSFFNKKIKRLATIVCFIMYLFFFYYQFIIAKDFQYTTWL